MTLDLLSGAAPFRRLAVAAGLGLLLVAAGLQPARAQAPTIEVVGFSAGQEGTAQAVTTVLDEDGAPVPGLPAEAFSAFVNDEAVEVTAVTRAVDSSQGIAVVLAIDVSGSMEGAPLEQAKTAALRFIESLAPQDEVAIVTFSDAAGTLLGFTQDRAALTYAISGLRAFGTTALYNATAESARLLQTSASARRAVILLSDGGIGIPTNTITRDAAVAAVHPLGAPVFTIGLGPQIDQTYLQELADTTGGEFIAAPSPEALALVYQRFAELLRGQYVLTLDTGGLSLDPQEPVTVQVSVDHAAAYGSGQRTFEPTAPGVRLESLPQGGRVTARTKLTAHVVSPDPIASVAFFIDDQLVHEVTAPPYEYVIDPAELENGGYDLRVEARTATGNVLTDEVGLRIGPQGGGLLSSPLLVGVGVVVLVVGLGGAYLLRRRARAGPSAPSPQPIGPLFPPPPIPFERRRRAPDGTDSGAWGEAEPVPALSLEEVTGWLVATAGPLAGQVFPVGGKPVGIGSGLRAAVRLPDRHPSGEEIPSEEARAWVRDGQLMVHYLLHLTPTGPVGGGWSILSPGETFHIGPSVFRFQLVQQADAGSQDAASAPEAPANSSGAPNVLRDRPQSDAPAAGQGGDAAEPARPASPWDDESSSRHTESA